MSGHDLASFAITASAAGNGILVLIALILFAVAAFIAAFLAPRNWWAVLVAAGLAVYLLAKLVGS